MSSGYPEPAAQLLKPGRILKYWIVKLDKFYHHGSEEHRGASVLYTMRQKFSNFFPVQFIFIIKYAHVFICVL